MDCKAADLLDLPQASPDEPDPVGNVIASGAGGVGHSLRTRKNVPVDAFATALKLQFFCHKLRQNFVNHLWTFPDRILLDGIER